MVWEFPFLLFLPQLARGWVLRTKDSDDSFGYSRARCGFLENSWIFDNFFRPTCLTYCYGYDESISDCNVDKIMFGSKNADYTGRVQVRFLFWLAECVRQHVCFSRLQYPKDKSVPYNYDADAWQKCTGAFRARSIFYLTVPTPAFLSLRACLCVPSRGVSETFFF